MEYIIVNGIKYQKVEEVNEFEEADKYMEELKSRKTPTCIDYPDCAPSCRANCYS